MRQYWGIIANFLWCGISIMTFAEENVLLLTRGILKYFRAKLHLNTLKIDIANMLNLTRLKRLKSRW